MVDVAIASTNLTLLVPFISISTTTKVIPLGIDDSIATTDACTKACMAAPWLYTLGFTTVFAAVFSKIWRVNRLLKKARSFRRVQISAKDVMLPFAILLTLNITFLLVWTIVDPMYWDRLATFGSDDGLSSYGTCVLGRTGVSTAMLACLVTLAFVVVVLANIEACKGRNVSTEFSESKYVGICMVCFLQVMVVGIPLIALVYTNPPAKYFVKVAIIFVLAISMLLLIFVPKMIFMRKEKARLANRNTTSRPNLHAAPTSIPTSDSPHEVSNDLRPQVPHGDTGLSRSQIKSLEKALKEAGVKLTESMNLEDIMARAGIPIEGTTKVRFCNLSSEATIPENGERVSPSTTHMSSQEENVCGETVYPSR